MKNIFFSTKIILVLCIISILPVACFKNLTQETVVYQNTFENNQRESLEIIGWNSSVTVVGIIPDKRISSFNGTHVLGKLNNAAITLQLPALPPHQILRAEMDLYIHDLWKNDLWKLSIDNANLLLTGFSNVDTIPQSYPNWLGNGSPLSPAGKDAIDIFQGSCSLAASPRGTSKYRIIITVPHSASSTTISFSDAGPYVNDTCKRGWSIDNLKVTAIKNY